MVLIIADPGGDYWGGWGGVGGVGGGGGGGVGGGGVGGGKLNHIR